jgi:glutamate 5-kinase
MSIDRLADLTDAAAAPRLVLKVGSSLLVERGGAVRERWLESLVAEIAAARVRGRQRLQRHFTGQLRRLA